MHVLQDVKVKSSNTIMLVLMIRNYLRIKSNMKYFKNHLNKKILNKVLLILMNRRMMYRLLVNLLIVIVLILVYKLLQIYLII